MHERFRTKTKRTAKNAKLSSQKFAFEKKNGYISKTFKEMNTIVSFFKFCSLGC